MSILDLPLVKTYRQIVDRLSSSELTGASEETREEVKAIRLRDGSEGASLHNTALETAIREKFVDLVAENDIGSVEFKQVWTLIDTINLLSDSDLCEPGLGFWLIEDLLDSQTIEGCRNVFDYLESRRERMTSKNFKQKSLVVLRCCNELLRRLSRAEDTVFCGRVFIYLFQSFPLGDKSSVNLRGEFHTENVTSYDEVPERSDHAINPMEIDSEDVPPNSSGAQTPLSYMQDVEHSSRTGRSTPAPRSSKHETRNEPPPDLDQLYPVFWSLQTLFSSPVRLFDATTLQTFKDGISATMSCFRYVANSSAPTTAPSDVRRGLKRKRSDVETDDSAMNSSTFNPKYLTNRDLFDLEVHDIAFRRHILVQALILIDFLLALTPVSKMKLQSIANPNKSVLYPFTLSDEDTKWAQTTRNSIASYLQQGNGLEGKSYYRMVDTVLSRDKNWARWKAEGCPLISRAPVGVKTTIEAQEALQKLSKDATAPLPTPFGANDLAFLNRVEPVQTLKDKRAQVPSLEEYYKGIQTDELDIDFATDKDEKNELEERKAGRLWRALRSARGRRFVLCEQIKNGENPAALIGNVGASVKKDPDANDGSKEEPTRPPADVEESDQVSNRATVEATNGIETSDAMPMDGVSV